MERLAAPLRNSPWVLGQEDVLIRIALHGLKGDLLMPPMGTLDDQQLAGVLTYIRGAGDIRPDRSRRNRWPRARRVKGRQTPWTRTELSARGAPR